MCNNMQPSSLQNNRRVSNLWPLTSMFNAGAGRFSHERPERMCACAAG